MPDGRNLGLGRRGTLEDRSTREAFNMSAETILVSECGAYA